MATGQDDSQGCVIKDLKGGDPGMLKSTPGKIDVSTSRSESPSDGG
jgi:hypothetical protein